MALGTVSLPVKLVRDKVLLDSGQIQPVDTQTGHDRQHSIYLRRHARSPPEAGSSRHQENYNLQSEHYLWGVF